MKPIGFIYLTTNLVNGKIYIGQHEFNKCNATYIGSGRKLKLAIKKYGKENFKRTILRVCKTRHELIVWEHVYIKKYHSQDSKIGYNIADGDVNTSGYCPVRNPEVIKKILKKRVGKFVGEKNPFYGKHHSEETRKKISEKAKGRIGYNKGKHLSEETKRKISEAQKGEKSWMYGRRGELCHNYGRKLSEKTKKRLSELLSGENNPNYGKKLSEEVRKKISKHHADVNGKNNPMFGKRGKDSPMYGRTWINDGIHEKFISIENGIPDGFKLGRIAKRGKGRKRHDS